MNEDGSKYAHGVRGYLNEGGWDDIHLIEIMRILGLLVCLDQFADRYMIFLFLLCLINPTDVEALSRLKALRVLNLGFNDIADVVLVHKGLHRLKCLELFDTKVGSNGHCHLSGLMNLQILNLSFTVIMDGGLSNLSGLSTVRSLNLDVFHITDAGLSTLSFNMNMIQRLLHELMKQLDSELKHEEHRMRLGQKSILHNEGTFF
ncbi:unnamed protein product [Lactuca saligna]|uniref:Uncharacterized protein n=1 Tax=Lactuca saligna TaxID=75948 RepID=A0AA35YXS3_LACSI|nr:unnamed protein product [Lactuca saligna]